MAKNRNRKVTRKHSAEQKELTANRKYKDTVFRMLFSDKVNLLSLYNAVNDSNYTDPHQLEIVTLENAVYMGMKNDLSFLIDTSLFLNEAVTHAVNDCIREGILEEFLRKNRSEVIAMSIFEYNKEEEERKIRKAEYEAGETRILNLIQRLALDGRSDEIPKLATDRNLLNRLLKEYNL